MDKKVQAKQIFGTNRKK